MVASRWLAASQDGASHQPAAPSSSPRYHRPNGKRTEQLREDGSVGGVGVTVWFTVQLEDRPGALAQVANALAERKVNITGIVGVAEDTDGALMLTTSDPAQTTRSSTERSVRSKRSRPTVRRCTGSSSTRTGPPFHSSRATYRSPTSVGSSPSGLPG